MTTEAPRCKTCGQGDRANCQYINEVDCPRCGAPASHCVFDYWNEHKRVQETWDIYACTQCKDELYKPHALMVERMEALGDEKCAKIWPFLYPEKKEASK